MTLTLPTALPAEPLLDLTDGLLRFARGRLAKATQPEVDRDRAKLLEDVVPGFEADLIEYFSRIGDRALSRIRKVEAFGLDPDDSIDWTVADDELETVLARWWADLGETAYSAVSEQLGVELRWDLARPGVKRVMGNVADRVKGINDTTRERLRGLVANAVERGTSVDDFEVSLRSMVESWVSTPAGGAVSRAHAIALTESAVATNLAAVEGYADSGLVEEVNIFDGPECGWTDHDDPDLADGSVRSLDEFRQYPVSHPHCQRAAGPVVAR